MQIDTPTLIDDLDQSIELIVQAIRDFGKKHIEPHSAQWDERQEFPRDTLSALGELGLMGILVPKAYGGSGLNYAAYAAIISELARIDGSIGLSVAAHNSLCTGHILQVGTEDQKQKYLPLLASGKWIGAWGLTEPNTGSDASNMSTVAVADGDHYVINGAKSFITHGKSAEAVVVIARTGPSRDAHAMTAFIVERGAPGFTAGKKENKMGMRASETTSIVFDQCRVHKSQVLGQPGEGFIQSLKVLEGGRISIAALSVGIARGAFEAALEYAKTRRQFDQPIANFQGISFKLADMAVEIEAAQALTQKAAHLKDHGQDAGRAAAMAKLYASETAVKTANEAIQIFGGYGYIKDFPVERFFRDARLCTIGEGTSEIQRLVIARSILK